MSEPPSPSRIRWLCRRGMLELDRLLGEYAERHYAGLSEERKHRFARLLAVEDDRLWDWFTGRETPPDEELAELVEEIGDRR